MKQSRFLSHAALLSSIMIWGASFIATRIAGSCFSPVLLGLIRFASSAGILGLIFLILRKPIRIDPRDYRAAAVSAVFGIAVYYSIENYGIALTSAGNAAIITSVYPIITILIGVLFFHDHVTIRQIIGIAAAVFGIAVLTLDPIGGGKEGAWVGSALMIANGINWGIYNYMIQSVHPETDSASLTLVQTVIATIASIPLLFLDMPLEIGVITPAVLFSVLFLTLACSLGAYYLYNVGLRGVEAPTAAALMNLMPVFGLFFSWSILHEPISLRQLCGAVIVIFGVVLGTVSLPEKNRTE